MLQMRQLLGGAVLLLAAAAGAAAAAKPKPHICFILADDWGQYNAGYRGDSDSRTPAVDALAAEGLVLERFCESPLPRLSCCRYPPSPPPSPAAAGPARAAFTRTLRHVLGFKRRPATLTVVGGRTTALDHPHRSNDR